MSAPYRPSSSTVATNIITFKGEELGARIDENARIGAIVEAMAGAFMAEEQPITLCLRDKDDRLVTQANLPEKVKTGERMRLAPAPAIEALYAINSLRRELAESPRNSIPEPAAAGGAGGPGADGITRSSNLDLSKLSAQSGAAGSIHKEGMSRQTETKLAMFNVQKYVHETDFAVDFILKGGVRMLVQLLEREPPLVSNSIAYGLQSMRGFLDYEASWPDITLPFIDKVIYWMATSTAPNILRPATAILRKTFMAHETVTSFVRSRSKAQAQSRSHHSHSRSSTGETEESSSGFYVTAEESATGVGTPAPRTFLKKGKARALAGIVRNDGSEGVGRFGFEMLWYRITDVGGRLDASATGASGAERVWKVVVRRLEGTGDLELVAQSLGLINAALKAGQENNGEGYMELASLIERLSVRKLVARLIPITSTKSLERAILAFQSRYAAILQHRRLVIVRPQTNPEHERMLADIWSMAGLGRVHSGQEGSIQQHQQQPQLISDQRTMRGWAKLGLRPGVLMGREDVEVRIEGGLFRDTGELGLECLHWFAVHEDNLANTMAEQLAKPEERRCPIGVASSECVKILCDHYKISSAALRPPTHFQAFLLQFPRLCHLVLTFFLRMWSESEATHYDFHRVSHLIRSQLTLSLGNESNLTWLSLEQDLLESDYRVIRERQMELLEREDGVMSTSAVRTLRETVGKDAYGALKVQRISCLLQGAWFNAAVVIDKSVNTRSKANPLRPIRFVRLSPNLSTIAWSDYKNRMKTNPPFESLKERLKINEVEEVWSATGYAVNSRSPNVPSKLSFSFMSRYGVSLLDLDAVHSEQRAEWIDGISEITRGREMKCPESEGYTKILTDLGVKVRLLDITGDSIEIPRKMEFGRAPTNTDFWFAT